MFSSLCTKLRGIHQSVVPGSEASSVDYRNFSDQVIGERILIETPFGQRPLVYADYTASGRAFAPIESFIQNRVLPFYANTHSESALSGRQTNALREQARQAIRDAVNAGPEHAVIFCGSGATAAINRLVDILGFRQESDESPVVLIGPYEHHSNELPWRESKVELEVIPLDGHGGIDQLALQARLELHSGRKLYCSFSAASNVTGIRTDTQAIGEMVHRHGGHVFWDYAAAAPYVGIDVSDKDAVFISPHKFLGGPGTPGVLVVRRSLLCNPVPAMPGGGTVSFVGPDFHTYLDDHERREEGGTPGIVESIRAGLVFKLQQAVGTDVIEAREHELVNRVIQRWSGHPNINVLGSPDARRLSIVSFQVMCGEQQLHYAYVVALLNDLFGIQIRGGCSCAGPYGHALLNIDADRSRELDREVSRGNAVLRPGWVRVNFNYFLDEENLEYLLRAVELVAEHGWKLLGDYRFNTDSGSWVHRKGMPALPASLEEFSLDATPAVPAVARERLSEFMLIAEQLLESEPAAVLEAPLQLDAQAERLRWFYLPPVQAANTPREVHFPEKT
jgi:selenocysteine lyase/cysteine desulfurase